MAAPVLATMGVDEHFAAAVSERAALDLRFELACPDARSEDGQRRVALSSETICIERRVVGIAMHVNVPTFSYRGVVLRAYRPAEAPTDHFEIRLSHEDASLEVILKRTDDDRDVIALWRAYAGRLSLPLLVEDREGRLLPVERLASSAADRRHGSAVRGRRPRFLVRRQPGIRDETVLRHIAARPSAH
jgi:hypothetical protein